MIQRRCYRRGLISVEARNYYVTLPPPQYRRLIDQDNVVGVEKLGNQRTLRHSGLADLKLKVERSKRRYLDAEGWAPMCSELRIADWLRAYTGMGILRVEGTRAEDVAAQRRHVVRCSSSQACLGKRTTAIVKLQSLELSIPYLQFNSYLWFSGVRFAPVDAYLN